MRGGAALLTSIAQALFVSGQNKGLYAAHSHSGHKRAVRGRVAYRRISTPKQDRT
jgi:hypothetical protein